MASGRVGGGGGGRGGGVRVVIFISDALFYLYTKC